MDSTTIKPKLKLFDFTIIVISLVIGMGIFRNPSEVALKAQVPSIFFAAWILGAIVSLIGALTFAEIGSRYPAAGGFYKIFSHCYHPAFAFMVNWVTVISNAASTGLVAVMGSAYIAPILLPYWNEQQAITFISISSVLIIYVVNLLGITVSSKILNILMFVKMGMLLLLISAMFFVEGPPEKMVQDIDPLPKTGDWIRAFGMCFIPVFFTYGGYQQTMNFGGDIFQPRKTMPTGIAIGISLILFFYLAVNYALYKVLGFDALQHTTTLAADVTGLLLGHLAYKLVSIIMFLAVMAYVNVSIMSNPRIYYAMAEDRVLPEIFKKIHARTQVQVVGVTVFCLFIVFSLSVLKSFSGILEYVMFFDSISLIAAAAAIFVLRKRASKSATEEEGIYKIMGYPYLPILYIIVYAAVNVAVLVSNPTSFAWGFVLFVIGLPLFYLLQFILTKNKK